MLWIFLAVLVMALAFIVVKTMGANTQTVVRGGRIRRVIYEGNAVALPHNYPVGLPHEEDYYIVPLPHEEDRVALPHEEERVGLPHEERVGLPHENVTHHTPEVDVWDIPTSAHLDKVERRVYEGIRYRKGGDPKRNGGRQVRRGDRRMNAEAREAKREA